MKVDSVFLGRIVISVVVILTLNCKEESASASDSKINHSLDKKVELRMSDGESSNQKYKPFLSGLVKDLLNKNFIWSKDSLFIKGCDSIQILDSIATALSSRLFLETDASVIVRELNNCFFNQMKMRVDNKSNTLHNLLPYEVLKKRGGNVFGGALIFLLLAEKADLPLFGALYNDHFYIQFNNGKTRLNIELERTGECMAESWYSLHFKNDKESGPVSEKLSNHELIGLMYHAIGDIFYSQGKNIAAIANFAYALKYYPTFKKSQTRLDYLVDREKGTDEILSTLIQLCSKDQELRSLDRCIGLLYLRKGDYKLSSEYYKRALEKSPHDNMLLKGAAIASVNLHDFETAKMYLGKVIAAAPDDSQALALINQCPK